MDMRVNESMSETNIDHQTWEVKMIANVKLEGTVNRIVTINNARFEAFDGSFCYGDGPNCDKYVADYDPELAEQLDRLCELVDATDEQYVSYDVNLVDDSISNLKIEFY